MNIGRLVFTSVAAGLTIAAASDPGQRSRDFEQNFRRAVQAAATEEGAAYDKTLEAYFFGFPDTKSQMLRCAEVSPGPKHARGYFSFGAAGGYRLILEPASEFSKCLAGVFDGRSPPSPPRRPYLNPFRFKYVP